MTEEKPLVSVGIPTYNRPDGLKRTLECMLAQTYTNLEIIVSDNASPHPEVEKIARDFANRDARIHYFKQQENKGGAFNFNFVLQQAHGEYFMWAADDDLWEPFYIERLVNELEKLGTSFVAANFEAQYMDENFTRFDFFPEAVPFYNFESDDPLQRIRHILSHNYGNLIYSLYRKEILPSYLVLVQNEIPFFLQISEKGNWRVLPEVGFFKKTVPSTYQQARWEMTGGGLTRSSLKSAWHSLRYSTRYHRVALDNIKAAIDTLNLSIADQVVLKSLTERLIWKHWFFLVIGYKPRPF